MVDSNDRQKTATTDPHKPYRSGLCVARYLQSNMDTLTTKPGVWRSVLPSAWSVLFDDGAVAVVSKPSGSPCAKAVDESLRRLNESTGEGWRVFRPRMSAMNFQDTLIFGNGLAAMTALESAQRAHRIQRTSLALVLGNVQPPADVTRIVAAHDKGEPILSVEVLQRFCTNAHEDGLSLLRIVWVPSCRVSALKSTLRSAGFPVVGVGKNTCRLPTQQRGNYMACVGVRAAPLFDASSASICSRANETPSSHGFQIENDQSMMDRIRRLAKKEEEAWKRTTASRTEVLLKHASGLSKDCVTSIAESRSEITLTTQVQSFCGLDFAATSDVFVPHASSACVVETAWELMNNVRAESGRRVVLDLGCGSGCLLLGALSKSPDDNWFGIGVDVDVAAVELSVRNAESFGLSERSAFFHLDYTSRPQQQREQQQQQQQQTDAPISGDEPSRVVAESGVSKNRSCSDDNYNNKINNNDNVDSGTTDLMRALGGSRVDLVLCNPPYVPDYMADKLTHTKAAPRRAVCGGADGLDMYRSLAALFDSREFCDKVAVKEGAKLVLEVPVKAMKRTKKRSQILSLFERLCPSLVFRCYGEKDPHGLDRCMVFEFV